DGGERTATTLLRQVDHAYPRQVVGQLLGDGERAVRAGVVRDRDAEGVGKGLREVGVQAPDAAREVGLLVVDRDHDVEDGLVRAGVDRGPRRQRAGSGGGLEGEG